MTVPIAVCDLRSLGPAPGIGHRLDGWANRDLNVGAIVSLAPDLSAFTTLLGVDEPTVKKVLASWGPGKFDAELNLDGKAFRPDGKPAATLIPPAFGLAGVNQHTWTGGWGNIPYWNAYVANLELNGRGNFLDARLDNAQQYPVAARAKLGHKRNSPDMVSAHLAALEFYQLALPVPTPRPGTFDPGRRLAARPRSTAKHNARPVMCRRSSPRRAGTRIRARRSALTIFSRIDRPIAATARRHSTD